MAGVRVLLHKLRLDQAFLIAVFVLEIFDFLNRLSPEWEVVDWAVSWLLFGYLLYQTSLSAIFFGVASRWANLLMLAGYFLLSGYKIVAFLGVVAPGLDPSSGLYPLVQYAARHGNAVDAALFAAGMALLIGAAVAAALRLRFGDPSVAAVLRLPAEPGSRAFGGRAAGSFLIIFGFFITVFNLMAEWLIIALDQAILMLCLLAYVLLLSRDLKLLRHEVAGTHWIHRVEGIAEDFYSEFLKHFVYRETLLLGLGGMLVLHLLTDLGIFLQPFVFGAQSVSYIPVLAHSATVWSLWAGQTAGLSWAAAALLGTAYLLNIGGMVALLVAPAYLWYLLYRHKQLHVARPFLVAFIAAVPAVFVAPIFSVESLMHAPGFVGVGITTHGVAGGLAAAGLAVGIGVVLGVAAGLGIRQYGGQKAFLGASIVAAFLFFARYVALYMQSWVVSLAGEIRAFWGSSLGGVGRVAFGGVFTLILVFSVVFYVAGFWAYGSALAKKTWALLKY